MAKIKKQGKSKVKLILGIFILGLGLFVASDLVQQNQENRSKATVADNGVYECDLTTGGKLACTTGALDNKPNDLYTIEVTGCEQPNNSKCNNSRKEYLWTCTTKSGASVTCGLRGSAGTDKNYSALCEAKHNSCKNGAISNSKPVDLYKNSKGVLTNTDATGTRIEYRWTCTKNGITEICREKVINKPITPTTKVTTTPTATPTAITTPTTTPTPAIKWKPTTGSCNITTGKYTCTSGTDTATYTFGTKASCEDSTGCDVVKWKVTSDSCNTTTGKYTCTSGTDSTYTFDTQAKCEDDFGCYICTNRSNAGGYGVHTQAYEMQMKQGYFDLEYTASNSIGQFEVFYDQNKIFDSGTMLGKMTRTIVFGPGQSTYIVVRATARNSATQWNYTIKCPKSGTPPAN